MQPSQIVIGFIAGGVLLSIAWAMESKLLRLVAVLVTAAFVISGLGVSRNAGMVMLAVIAAAWVAMSLYLKHKPREMEFGKDFMQDLKARVEVREALMPKEVTSLALVPEPIPVASNVIDLAELTEEERIESLEKEAALAEREAAALLRKRAAGRQLEKAFHEDAIEAARQQRALEKTVNPPEPPLLMTPEQKLKAIFELEAAKKADKLKLINEGHKEEDSDALDLMNAIYEKKLKALNALPTSK